MSLSYMHDDHINRGELDIKINIKIASQVGRHCLGICLGRHLPGLAGVWWTQGMPPELINVPGEGPRS